MSDPRELSEPEFEACWANPMKDVTDGASIAINIWPYVDALDPIKIGVQAIFDVTYVYQDARARFHHVLVETDQENVILVIVIDLNAQAVLGHHLLDMNIKYGISTSH